MSYGVDARGLFGFSDVKDWVLSVLLSYPAPWSIRSLDRKYYGTEIEDGDGRHILSVWLSHGEPSDRELADMSIEAWYRESMGSDGHWESKAALGIAEAIVACRGSDDKRKGRDETAEDALMGLVLEFASWDDDLFPELVAGGRLRRRARAEKA